MVLKQEKENIDKGITKIKDKERQGYLQKFIDERDSYPKFIKKPITQDYEFHEITYTQSTEINLEVAIGDEVTKKSANIPITYSSIKEEEEITNVKENDYEGHQNQKLIMTGEQN